MNATIVVAIITGVFGLISGAAVAYLTAVIKFRKDLEAAYDKDLRERRLGVYISLWTHLQTSARYDRPEPLTARTLKQLTVAMRDWYFGESGGGLYLSEKSRLCYFDLKETIAGILRADTYQADGSLRKEDAKVFLEQASTLRAGLTHDVGTRKSSPVADS